MSDYNASKAAMIVWSKTLSLELGPEITVNSVCPAFIDTPLWENLAGELTGRLGDTVADVYQAMIDANLVSCYLCCGAAVRAMIEQNRGAVRS